jgi:hypothetical protein
VKWGRGLKHPLGVALLSASVVLAALAALGIGWSGQQEWLLVWGVAIYAIVTVYIAISHREQTVAFAPLLQPVSDTKNEPTTPDILRLTEDALRHLGNPGFLATSGLIVQLPYTIAASRGAPDKMNGATPLDYAQVLRSVLTRSLEKLRLAEGETGSGEEESLQYHILHEHYVTGRPATYTMTRHFISEANFHRKRREAVRALAADLSAQEEMLSRALPVTT